jgi:uncharacterized membrane-anchored protein
MKLILLSAMFSLGLALPGAALAQQQPEKDPKLAALRQKFDSLRPQTGTVSLHGGISTIEVPKGIQYLDSKDSKTILVDFWGNPPQSAEGVLGMLVESPERVLSKGGWGIVITYSEDGRVDDSDAQSINYSELLKQMQAGSEEASKERAKQGYETIKLVGWAEPPHYDPVTHKIYWAKEIQFGGSPDNTLNYCTRILGRRGVLELNAVAPVSALDDIRLQMQKVLPKVDFTDGNRYADFNPSTDKLATYGVAALVAGGVAAKMGFFKTILFALLAAKKFLIIGVVALVAAISKFFKGKDS